MFELLLDQLTAVLAPKGGRKSSLYADIKSGTWTPPVKVGSSSLWPHHENQTLAAALIAGATREEMRAIVRALVEQRKALMPQIEGLCCGGGQMRASGTCPVSEPPP